jgi:hypothetical protein
MRNVAILFEVQWDSLQPDVREDRLEVLESRMATCLLKSNEPVGYRLDGQLNLAKDAPGIRMSVRGEK